MYHDRSSNQSESGDSRSGFFARALLRLGPFPSPPQARRPFPCVRQYCSLITAAKMFDLHLSSSENRLWSRALENWAAPRRRPPLPHLTL